MVGRDSCQPLEVRVADEVLDMIRPLYERMEKKLEKKIEKIFEKNMEKVFEKYMEKELEKNLENILKASNHVPTFKGVPKERSLVCRSPNPSHVGSSGSSSIKERELDKGEYINSVSDTFNKLDDFVAVGNMSMKISEVVAGVSSSHRRCFMNFLMMMRGGVVEMGMGLGIELVGMIMMGMRGMGLGMELVGMIMMGMGGMGLWGKLLLLMWGGMGLMMVGMGMGLRLHC
ncbi:uncharacterized protein LOC110698345 [Chenopodium quinoa]|uniref:uncharacterized protein LOC110698345 n=1 Tax=Chenopodium quinoa TaxID=63459 RepID=UPI000B76BB7F|nr:uncharacterized protein LOC110698345 [Chenopodium quinoa]